jgi:hypothetical protein
LSKLLRTVCYNTRRWVAKYSGVAPPSTCATYAKLAPKGGAKLDQIQLSLSDPSLTTKRYLVVHQDLSDVPCDYIKLDLSAAAAEYY